MSQPGQLLRQMEDHPALRVLTLGRHLFQKRADVSNPHGLFPFVRSSVRRALQARVQQRRRAVDGAATVAVTNVWFEGAVQAAESAAALRFKEKVQRQS